LNKIFCLLALTWLLVPQPAGGEETSVRSDPDEGRSWRFWMFSLEEYRLRTAGASGGGGELTNPAADDESDHDLRLFLEAGVRDPGDHFGAEASLGLWLDVDGSLPEGDVTGLSSIYDYRQPWWDVFKLQADYQGKGALGLVRAGRQVTEYGLPVTFDGASLRLNALPPVLQIFAFGGRSVHFFETRADVFEDWIGSLGAVIRPLKNLRLELDYRLLSEDVLNSDRESQTHLTDHTYGLNAWLRHRDWMLARAYLRGLNDTLSHAGAAVRVMVPRLGLGASLNLDAQVVTLDEINERQDPFYALLGESLPHLRWRVDAWKSFETASGDYSVHAGWNGRDLLSGEESAFNRNVGRIYLQLEASDLAVKGLFASFAAEGHYTHLDGRLSGDLILTLGGSAGFESGRLRAETGSYYQRYKYDYYRDLREIDDVRTWYVLLSWRPVDWLKLRARYDFERSDRDFHTVTLTVSQSF